MTVSVTDFTLHLAGERSLEDALDLRRVDPYARLDRLADSAASAGVTAGNVMILDADIFRRDGADLVAAIRECGFAATAMIDPRDPDAHALLLRAAEAGCRGLKFHPYLQVIRDEEFGAAVDLARSAEELDMWVAVCCSYGTVRVHEISGPRLVARLVRSGIRTPVVALHAGGAAVLDVMSVALEAANVLLETSYSVPFWNGSSVEQDIAFAIRTVGAHRCLHGSDHPHVPVAEAVDQLEAFLRRHGFDDEERASLFEGTARESLGLG